MQKITLKVTGMSCNHCKMAVEKALKGIEGVNQATVDLGEGTAEVTYEESKVQISQLQQAVEDAGYEVMELY